MGGNEIFGKSIINSVHSPKMGSTMQFVAEISRHLNALISPNKGF